MTDHRFPPTPGLTKAAKQPRGRTTLRLSADLHARLVDAARLNHRSFNGELLARLEASFAPLTATIASIGFGGPGKDPTT